MEQKPPAIAALDGLPRLREMVAPALRRQAARIAAYQAWAQARPALDSALDELLRGTAGGVVLLEGPPGSGVTSTLIGLALRRPLPLWLTSDDGALGSSALYAQIVALHRPAVPLIDPAVATDPGALDRLLGEVAARGRQEPLALAIDLPADGGQPLLPGPLPLPGALPPGVTLLLGCEPGQAPPLPVAARLRLPDDDPELPAAMARLLARRGAPGALQPALIAAAGGNFLYLDLALGLLEAGALPDAAEQLPRGLDGLLDWWWGGLGPEARRLALLLAAAAEPLPLTLAADLLGADPEPTLHGWERSGLVDLTVQAAREEARGPAGPLLCASLRHPALRRTAARAAPAELAAAHSDMAVLGAAEVAREQRRPGGDPGGPAGAYLIGQWPRHAALGDTARRDGALPQSVDQGWLRLHERRGSLAEGREGARWELRSAAASGAAERIVRAAALAGKLATLARGISAGAAAEALLTGIERGGREPALKRVLDLVERLPDGPEKAQILRQLGEACYGAGMRSSAMRLLSRALDLEAQPVSAAWREQREQLLAALAHAALALGDPGTALAIAERIEHLERRALVETQVVRRLLAGGALDRAQRLARDILHESMGAWARAEAAVALVRGGDPRGLIMLDEIEQETVAAWAQIELACDAVERGDAEAGLARIQSMGSPGQRDRGLAQLAVGLARTGRSGEGLLAAGQIGSAELRVAALLDLRPHLPQALAAAALEQAAADLSLLEGDARVPLVAALGAAQAAQGQLPLALATVGRLAEGEERDRALARVAVALAQRGGDGEARLVLAQLGDDDERDWANDEIARLAAAAGRWDEAVMIAGRISADDQRARTSADLAILRARAGDPRAGLAMALALDLPAERVRALILLAPLLVAGGLLPDALALAGQREALPSDEARSRVLAATVAAMAQIGQIEQGAALLERIARPLDRARAGLALAEALAADDHDGALRLLGTALRTAAVGREEVFRALELAAAVLGRLGGAELLGLAATTIDSVDRW